MPQSLNRFAYVNGNPLKYTDPTGNDGVIWDGWVNQPDDPRIPELLNFSNFAGRWLTYQAANAYTLGWFGNEDVTFQQYQQGKIDGLDFVGLSVANTGIAAVKAVAVVASIVYLPVLATGLAAYGLSTAAVATITTAVGVADGVAQLALSDALNMHAGFQKDWSPRGAYYLAGGLGGLGGFGAGIGASRAGIAVEQAESIGAKQVALTARPVGKMAGGVRGAAPKGARARIGEFLEQHPRLNPRNYSVKAEGLGSNIGNVTVRYKAPRDFPHGFNSRAEFDEFGSQLNNGLREAGIHDAQAVFQGSSVTGKKFTTGEPFDVGRVSDFDIGIASPELMTRARSIGVPLRSGGARTAPLSRQHLSALGLEKSVRSLSRRAGRPVNFMLYESTEAATSRAPSILVPRE